MPQKTYLAILKSGIYLSLLSVFLVSSKLLFPYITSKQIYFNILIEILLVFWIALIIKYPSYRPKQSWITIGLISYFAAILISSIFSIDFNLSFWGDVERMLGFFHVLHFLFFYFIVITVFREWKDWKILLIISVICAVIVSFYGLANMHYSTIGNTAYVSGYLIFNIYFALLLFIREKNKGLRWIYLISIPIMLLEFNKANTSGAIIGLGISIFAFFFLLAVFGKNKKLRIYGLASFAIAVLLVAMIFINKESNLVKNNNFLSRLTRNVSLQKVTFQTRLISWKAAAKDFKNHPVLGTGYGNYAITFDKYFDPKFYNYTRAETYFDRAHNNLIDIASTSGILGLLSYLSIFLAAGYYIISGYRKGKISLIEFSLITSLIIAYFIQNLAVFDSLVTYIGLMATLGFVYWLVTDPTQPSPSKGEGINSSPSLRRRGEGEVNVSGNKEFYAFLVAGLIIFFVLYQYNLKPLKMLKGVINGQIAFSQQDIAGGYEIYKKALSYDTILDRDGRDSFVRLLTNATVLKQINEEKAKEIADYAISLAERNVQYNFEDSLMQVTLAQILNTAVVVYSDDAAAASDYGRRALLAADKSIAASPGRIPHYFQKAQILLTLGKGEEAIETLKYAERLNEDYYESTCMLAKVQIILEKKEGYESMNKCIDKGGVGQLSPAGFVGQLINYYYENKDNPRVLKLYERLAQLDSSNAKVWANLAKLYAEAGEKEKAVETAEKVAELDPTLKDEVDVFLRSLEE
jgi:O-antigen ligase